jgi:hypothetical protein
LVEIDLGLGLKQSVNLHARQKVKIDDGVGLDAPLVLIKDIDYTRSLRRIGRCISEAGWSRNHRIDVIGNIPLLLDFPAHLDIKCVL